MSRQKGNRPPPKPDQLAQLEAQLLQAEGAKGQLNAMYQSEMRRRMQLEQEFVMIRNRLLSAIATLAGGSSSVVSVPDVSDTVEHIAFKTDPDGGTEYTITYAEEDESSDDEE